ncbi:HNH endonuclease [Pseudonocardia sp. KRD-184]|uniref:HNH endonuclease n=1 Tax=Pseudonocardia oceani TaxID=2792013 RepID=A0ABS6UKU4_9PSEU|nr:HNH endonuclease signature motif containing protein [Pseudonocardia oceani]MBW0088238.1 HNH endonuclease [Pseudonocardia oceani]MBW0095020.1 HNH endonuclease [Pseudonocardia oceani]MBW0121127.1 HNH endonuclease [Pseudonocardia oceani]MBW0131187.1 HNH endonuclease [Pseudonocardia oceani]MBW0132551.1 HNH endonuclease [Pseudonocardia oceani]
MTQCKTCSRCQEPKPIDQFGPSKQTADGLFRYCRPCKRASDNRSYAKHRDRRKPVRHEHYLANRSAYIARATAAYHADRNVVKRRAREWAEDNPERRRQIRLESQARRYAIDPERKREVWRRRHAAIKRGCSVYPFTSAQLEAKVAYWGARCWMCSAPYDAIDHVKPLAKQGPHMLANLRPVCTPCNTRKRDRWPLL